MSCGGRRAATVSSAGREIARADVLLVSPISCREIAALLVRGRIALDREVYTIRDLLGRDGFHGDPADRLLYATARELGVPFVTKDSAIRTYAKTSKDVRVIW